MTDLSWERYLTQDANHVTGAKRPGLSRAKPARPAIGPMAVTTAPKRFEPSTLTRNSR